MDDIRIIQQGEEAKCRIEIAGFDMSEGNFKVELMNGYRRTTVEVSKGEMFQDRDYRWYFVFETAGMVGKVVSRCVWHVADKDASGGVREMVDEQVLCFVAAGVNARIECGCAGTDTGVVSYEFVEDSDIASRYRLLSDFYGHRIMTADGEYLAVTREEYAE